MVTKDGKPEMFTGEITALDLDLCLLCFMPKGTRDFFTLDLDGAIFRIGKRKLEAEREGNILSFEQTTA